MHKGGGMRQRQSPGCIEEARRHRRGARRVLARLLVEQLDVARADLTGADGGSLPMEQGAQLGVTRSDSSEVEGKARRTNPD